DGEPGSEPRESEIYFLKQALAPVPAEYLADYFIHSSIALGADFSQARLNDYDVVVLANVADFSQATAEALRDYLRGGGGLIVFPGARVNRQFYNEELHRRLQILPAALGAPQGEAGQDESFVTLQDKNYEHRMVDLWNDPGAGTLSSARFFRRFALEPGLTNQTAIAGAEGTNASATTSQLVLRYSDGVPAVMERDLGLGRCILFSSTGDTSWNDLAVRPSFVPLLHRALGSIVQRQDEGLNIRVGEKFMRRAAMEQLEKDATFFKPAQANAQRVLRRVDLVNGWPTLQYDETDLAGLYEVAVADSGTTLKFAAQPNAYESSLEPMTASQMTTVREVAQVIPWGPEIALRNLVAQQRTGMEFWFPLLVAVLALAITETALGQWFSRSK
ncbi:MAG TPA: hypothetical protein VK633_05290, partial [Verrucomicrobiae bacterium]|nr:hypothetical protein [Verrucomicrobiae bacterium]